MAIIAAGRNDVLLRYVGREVSVRKSDLTSRGQETRDQAQTRIANSIKGTDRECEVDFGPPMTFWQGPLGSTRVVIKP